jgi:hypothetical protein
MKIKTIKKLISQKFDEFAASITDETVKKLVEKNSIITGGAIASMLMREQVNDFDIYFRNKETTIAVANYYLEYFRKSVDGIGTAMFVEHDVDERVRIVIKSAGVANAEGTTRQYQYFETRPDAEAGKYVDDVIPDPGQIEDTYQETEKAALEVENEKGKPKYRPVFITTNAITLANKIQLILRFYGEPDQIHKNYDFVHCTNYWTSWDDKLVLRQAALEALMTKELRYVGSKYPVCSIIRLRKFLARQWTINAGQILKMIMQINDLDLTDPKILQDQLTGVDSAYFAQLIERLAEKDPLKIDAAYLVEIIERIF